MMRVCNIKNITLGEGKPKICVSITGTTEDQIFDQVERIVGNEDYSNKVDVIEFRADFYQDLTDNHKLNNLLGKLSNKLAEKIFLFTIRTRFEGGVDNGLDYAEVTKINKAVIESGYVDMLDVELYSGEENVKLLLEAAKINDVKIIMSNHDFNTTPSKSEIINRLAKMQALGADIAKIAVMPENSRHVIDLLDATFEMKEDIAEVPIVTISMSAKGSISRIMGQLYGSAMTFAALDKGSAPGQISIDKLSTLLNAIDENL